MTNAKLTFTITGTAGTDNSDATEANRGHLVALIATDTYDLRATKMFRVMVNNAPKAEGAQPSASDVKTLGAEDGYMSMSYDSQTETDDRIHLALVEASGGYFHDPDPGDTLTCYVYGETGDDYVEFTLESADGSAADPRGLLMDPKAVGTATVTIGCTDTFEIDSPTATLTTRVLRKSRSLQ